jgi:tetratricopeptide (TPR) repeat protein
MLFAIVAVFMFAALDAPLRAQAGRRRAPEVRQGVLPVRSNIETLYLQARRELNTGQYAAALATLDKIIETDPEFPDAQLARAQALALLKRPREAAEAYRRVVAMTPADTRARYELARVYRQLGEHGAAIAELKEVTRLEPMNSRAYNQLGATYLSLDEAGAAAGAFLQATEADRANTAAEAALERLVNEDATRGAATSSLAAAIYARPLSALARYHYIRALFLSGRRRDATKHMKALEKLDTALWAKLQKEIGA